MNELNDLAPAWKQYENDIFKKLASEFPDHEITYDESLPGRFSRIERQIDILVRRDVVGAKITAIVDCKYFGEKIDVKKVEEFIGMVRDVNAELGILITNRGYSEAAERRALNDRGIRTMVVDIAHLDEYTFFSRACQVCPTVHDNIPGTLWSDGLFDEEGPSEDLDNFSAALWHCDTCGTRHMECGQCGTVNEIFEAQYGEPVFCEGACGLKFVVHHEYFRKDEDSYFIEIIGTNEKWEDLTA